MSQNPAAPGFISESAKTLLAQLEIQSLMQLQLLRAQAEIRALPQSSKQAPDTERSDTASLDLGVELETPLEQLLSDASLRRASGQLLEAFCGQPNSDTRVLFLAISQAFPRRIPSLYTAFLAGIGIGRGFSLSEISQSSPSSSSLGLCQQPGFDEEGNAPAGGAQ